MSSVHSLNTVHSLLTLIDRKSCSGEGSIMIDHLSGRELDEKSDTTPYLYSKYESTARTRLA